MHRIPQKPVSKSGSSTGCILYTAGWTRAVCKDKNKKPSALLFSISPHFLLSFDSSSSPQAVVCFLLEQGPCWVSRLLHHFIHLLSFLRFLSGSFPLSLLSSLPLQTFMHLWIAVNQWEPELLLTMLSFTPHQEGSLRDRHFKAASMLFVASNLPFRQRKKDLLQESQHAVGPPDDPLFKVTGVI